MEHFEKAVVQNIRSLERGGNSKGFPRKKNVGEVCPLTSGRSGGVYHENRKTAFSSSHLGSTISVDRDVDGGPKEEPEVQDNERYPIRLRPRSDRETGGRAESGEGGIQTTGLRTGSESGSSSRTKTQLDSWILRVELTGRWEPWGGAIVTWQDNETGIFLTVTPRLRCRPVFPDT